MNEAFLCEMILKDHERFKRAQFIHRDKDYNTFSVRHVFKLIKGVRYYQYTRHARPISTSVSDDLFRKPFLCRWRVTTKKYFYALCHIELAILKPTIPFAICQAKENSF